MDIQQKTANRYAFCIYARIEEKMLPYHRRALQMLDDTGVGSPDFADRIARLSLLNLCIKRGTNLLLTGEGQKEIPFGNCGLS